jgi:hypothetical protein
MALSIVPLRCLFCKDRNPLTVTAPRQSLRIDMTGRRYGKLLVRHFVGMVTHRAYWCCLCQCGTLKVIQGESLRKGATRSCGCLWRETVWKVRRTTHAMSHTNLYRRWQGMIQRCTNPHTLGFHRYGARGITVCDRWLQSFEAFYADMGDPPPGAMLERVDNDGP